MAGGAVRDGVTLPEPDGAPGSLGEKPGGSGESERIEAALLGLLDRTLRRRRALERELASGPDPEQLRAAGHLLLARLHEVPAGADVVRLLDFDGSERTIRLDPSADAAANAERYYERARRRERAERGLPKRIASARERERRLRRLVGRLRAEGPNEAMRSLAARVAPEPRSEGVPRGVAARRPWRRLRSAGGLEIRVGRSARDNDDLTFHHSSPEDIWLHARHAHGAHVILRWGRRDQNPPARDLEDAAVAAAVFSEARGSGAVPVDWTRRKHVRKPRKAPPGAVVPDRVRTLFVAPDAARVRRMNDDGPDAV
jgi:predicted ribosome quality control (RQC) complex YloA/Tae2 family protein